jgi:CRP-like cAMP-binding protein
VDILEPLPLEELERLASLSSSMRLEAGEAVALYEDRKMLLLLASGRVRVHEPSTSGGPDLTISMIEERTVVAQSGFASRLSRALRVEALQPSTMLILRWEDLEELVLRNPEVRIKTIRLLSERLAVCEGRLSDLIRKQVIARLAVSYSASASTRTLSHATAAVGYPPATPTSSWRAWWDPTGKPSQGPSGG